MFLDGSERRWDFGGEASGELRSRFRRRGVHGPNRPAIVAFGVYLRNNATLQLLTVLSGLFVRTSPRCRCRMEGLFERS
jgi:hypothetical protein